MSDHDPDTDTEGHSHKPNRLRRRALLLAIPAAAYAIAVAAPWIDRQWKTRQRNRRLSAQFAEAFGPEIAATDQAAAFLVDFEQALMRGQITIEPTALITAFCRSSNVVAQAETGEPLNYAGLFLPYETPCGNALGANFAPDGEHEV